MKLVPPPPRQREQSGTHFTLPGEELSIAGAEAHAAPGHSPTGVALARPSSAALSSSNRIGSATEPPRDAISGQRASTVVVPAVSRGATTHSVDDLDALDEPDDGRSSLGPLHTSTVYDAYATFVWRSLQRMGVPTSDLEDALQEVFIVVHRKLPQYDAERAKLSTWLFGISLNVARKHRTRSRLTFGFDIDAQVGNNGNQETLLQSRQQAERLNTILGKMKPEHSATFVMFELEALSCQEIADLTGVPVGTVYSRLHKAREQFKELAEKAEKAPNRVLRLAQGLFARGEELP